MLIRMKKDYAEQMSQMPLEEDNEPNKIDTENL